MIKLTVDSNKKLLYINPDLVQSVLPVDDATRITVAHDVLFVAETPEEVVRKIMEYKLLNTKLSAFYNVHAIDPEDERSIIDQIRLIRISLDNLAGLEESPDA